MKFLSIYKTVETGTPPSAEEMERMSKLIEEGMKAGYLLAVEGCLPSAMGARVRLSNGRVSVTDGPFAETREVVGGFAILQAGSKQEAIELVKTFPNVAGDGECEIRSSTKRTGCPGLSNSRGVARYALTFLSRTTRLSTGATFPREPGHDLVLFLHVLFVGTARR
jgi:hypothetical protein